MSQDKSILQALITGPSEGYVDVFPDREMWLEIAEKLGGEFKIRRSKSQNYEIHQLRVPYKKWVIEATVSSHRPFKFRMSFNQNLDFEMFISWEDFIERLWKRISKPEIQLVHKAFDQHYLIKSNRPELVKRILSREIQNIMLKYNLYSISYQNDSGSNTAELLGVIQRKAGHQKMIYELIYLFQLIIDQMEKARIIK